MPPFQVILHDHACMHESYLGRVGKHADAADDLPAGIPLSDTATKNCGVLSYRDKQNTDDRRIDICCSSLRQPWRRASIQNLLLATHSGGYILHFCL